MLEALFNATDGPHLQFNTNWKTSAPLDSWHGVTTDNNGRVSGINLAENQLAGELPAEIGILSELEQLTFDFNQLTGRVPKELGSLSKLERLSLSVNYFGSSLPSEIGNLSNLRHLDVYDSGFRGEITRSIGQLTRLQVLNLGTIHSLGRSHLKSVSSRICGS